MGYIPGAGDDVAQSLEGNGLRGDRRSAGADLTPERLKDFDAVVIGVRAFNVRDDLASHLPALFAYVEAGGNVIEQYNRPGAVAEAASDLRRMNCVFQANASRTKLRQ